MLGLFLNHQGSFSGWKTDELLKSINIDQLQSSVSDLPSYKRVFHQVSRHPFVFRLPPLARYAVSFPPVFI